MNQDGSARRYTPYAAAALAAVLLGAAGLLSSAVLLVVVVLSLALALGGTYFLARTWGRGTAFACAALYFLVVDAFFILALDALSPGWAPDERSPLELGVGGVLGATGSAAGLFFPLALAGLWLGGRRAPSAPAT